MTKKLLVEWDGNTPPHITYENCSMVEMCFMAKNLDIFLNRVLTGEIPLQFKKPPLTVLKPQDPGDKSSN